MKFEPEAADAPPSIPVKLSDQDQVLSKIGHILKEKNSDVSTLQANASLVKQQTSNPNLNMNLKTPLNLDATSGQ